MNKTSTLSRPPLRKPQKLERPVNTKRPNKSLAIKAIDGLLPLAVVGLMLYYTLTVPVFLSMDNLLAIVNQNVPTIIIAIPLAIMLMSGYVDLSVGSILAVAGVSAGLAFVEWGALPGIIIGLAVGLTFGLITGVLVGYLSWSPLVVTLGMLALGRGIAQLIAPQSVYNFPPSIVALGSGTLFGVPYLIWIAALVVMIGLIVLERMPAGQHIVAIGVNQRAAYLAGVNVRSKIFGLYIALGGAAGLAGVLQVARLNSAPSASLGLGFELTVLTAVMLGGIAFTGGKGSLWRVLLGVWLLGVLKNGITLMNISPEISEIATGGVLVLAAGLEAVRARILKR